MQKHAKIGLVLLRSSWGGCGHSQEVTDMIQAQGQAIEQGLLQRFDLRGTWVASDQEEVRACIRGLSAVELDLVILAFQTLIPDDALQTLLRMPCSCPMVVWNVLPWRRLARPVPFSGVLRSTGAVSAFGALGTLRDQNIPFLFTWGAVDDPRLLHDLEVSARAACLRGALRRARFGLLPQVTHASRPTQVDEARLLSDLGPYVEHIAVDSLCHSTEAVTQAEIEAYLADLRSQADTGGVPPETLVKAARLALGLKGLAAARRLDLLALDYKAPELLDNFQMRAALYPELAPPEARPQDAALYQPGVDLGAATANYILSKLTGAPAMFLEFWYWDQALNQMVGGHGGMQDPALGAPGQVWISRDYHACEDEDNQGAQVQMIGRPGRVTLFQMRSTPSSWQAVAASGVVLESRPVVEGFPHVLLRMDTQIEQLLNRLAAVGVTQHWVMCYGSVLHELETFCKMVHIPLEILSY